MKKIIYALLLLIGFNAKAQQNQNIEDLDFLYQAIKQTQSYKNQLKNDKVYAAIYSDLKTNFTDTNELAVYKKLYRLIEPIKDNHLGFYKMVDTNLKRRPLVLKIDADSLRQKLKEKPLQSLEGIYDSEKQEFAVFKSAVNEYSVLHLKSKMVVGFIIETSHKSLDYISLLNVNRGFVLARNIKHIDGNFNTINLYKTAKTTLGELKIGSNKFEFKKLTAETDYLRLSSFYSDNANIAAASKFFQQMKDSVNAPNLIVDVRNNSGGGFRVSQQFINFIKSYKGKVFILQNLRTASNAEKFLVRLKGRKNVVTLGETTIGTLAFGSNYGKTLSLPHSKFYFYPTDTFDSIDLPYENVGVEPDVNLGAVVGDWIAHTLEYIKKKP